MIGAILGVVYKSIHLAFDWFHSLNKFFMRQKSRALILLASSVFLLAYPISSRLCPKLCHTFCIRLSTTVLFVTILPLHDETFQNHRGANLPKQTVSFRTHSVDRLRYRLFYAKRHCTGKLNVPFAPKFGSYRYVT